MFDMRVLRDAHMPTHVLAARQSDHSIHPTMLPINLAQFEQAFRVDLNVSPPPPGSTAPVPRMDEETQNLVVSLPVVHMAVPHVESLPLLLLYAMKLETDLGILAHHLLPVQVVAEFPSLPAMLHYLCLIGEIDFERLFRFNQGIRNNTLVLLPTNQELDTVIGNAWHAAAEARRARQRALRQQ